LVCEVFLPLRTAVGNSSDNIPINGNNRDFPENGDKVANGCLFRVKIPVFGPDAVRHDINRHLVLGNVRVRLPEVDCFKETFGLLFFLGRSLRRPIAGGNLVNIVPIFFRLGQFVESRDK